jgi:DNA-binding transcriptional ArsR family regulator
MSSQGEADLSVIGRLLAEPARARALMALTDGQWLPASTLALEAGVSNSTMSGHLARLLDGGMLSVRHHGRYRYYRLAGPHVAELVEVMAKLAPTLTITSLKAGTRAHAIRRARRCYDHLGGRLAVAITEALIADGHLTGHDGSIDPDRMPGRPAGGVLDPVAYALTREGAAFLHAKLGVPTTAPTAVRCCVDWTEHRHHAAGHLGRDLLATFEAREWIKPAKQPRALVLTASGQRILEETFHLDLEDSPPA